MMIHIWCCDILHREQLLNCCLHNGFVLFIRHHMCQHHPYLTCNIIFIPGCCKEVLFRAEEYVLCIVCDQFQFLFIHTDLRISYGFGKCNKLLHDIDHLRLSGRVFVKVIGPVYEYRIVLIRIQFTIFIEHL